MNLNRVIFVLFALSLFVTSCKKKNKQVEETPPVALTPNVNTSPNVVINIPSDADGVLMASIVPYKFPNGSMGTIGRASAVFYKSASDHSYIDGGTVRTNDSILPKDNGGSYYFFGKAIFGQAHSGIDIRDSSYWQIEGNTTTAVPSFSYIFKGMPVTVTAGPDKASKSHPYEIFFSPSMGADSISVVLSGDSVSVKKTVVGGSASLLFTVPEVAGIRKQHTTSLASLTVIAYKITSVAVASKRYYFVNSNTSKITAYIGD